MAALPVVLWFSVGNVQLAKFPDAGVPSAGVTSVGLLDSTTAPDPVDDVTPVPPRATGSVPVVPPSIGRPVALVITPLAGVPSAGVTNVGLLDNTTLPVPVEAVTPVPPLATGSVPVTPVVRGRPVTLVITPLVGVPSAGVTSVGLISVGDAESALVATAVAMLLNSVLISVPLTIFRGSPEASASLVAKLVLCT